MGFRGPIGLSSIGPDDYVMSEAYFSDFVRFSTESNFDYVVAWDVPTYADWPPDLSWKNTLHGLKRVRRLIKQGLNVIGLLNGSNRTHFEECAESLLSMDIDSVAVHVSDYLRRRDDYLLSSLLGDALRVASSKFHKVLAIRAMDPYFMKHELKGAIPEISVSGLSWFIEARQGVVYGARGRINANENDITCNCAYCRTSKPRALSKSTYSRAIHNFVAARGVMEGNALPNLQVFDLVHSGQKIMMVSVLHFGTKESLASDFFEALRKEKPKALVLLGGTFDLAESDYRLLRDQARSFFNSIIDVGCEVYPVFGTKDSSLNVIAECLKKFAYHWEIHPNIHFTRYIISDPSEHLFEIYKFYAIAKDSLLIRLADGRRFYAAHGPLWVTKFPQSASVLEGLPRERIESMLRINQCDCLVLGGYHKNFVQEDKIYTLGSWQRQTEDQRRIGLEPDLKGALILDKAGIRYREYP